MATAKLSRAQARYREQCSEDRQKLIDEFYTLARQVGAAAGNQTIKHSTVRTKVWSSPFPIRYQHHEVLSDAIATFPWDYLTVEGLVVAQSPLTGAWHYVRNPVAYRTDSDLSDIIDTMRRFLARKRTPQPRRKWYWPFAIAS